MLKVWVAVGLVLVMTGCSGFWQSRAGVKDGKLRSCPITPNCVNSEENWPLSGIEPISYEGSPEEARTRLLAILKDRKRVNVVKVEDRYIYAEFTSAIIGFVDDVEFLIVEAPKVIHVRSASRLGITDFFVNRIRVEGIRERFAEAGKEKARP